MEHSFAKDASLMTAAISSAAEPLGETRRRDSKAQPTRPTANPLTYPKSAEPFSLDLFKSPTSEYRGCPLWSWNAKLRKEQLLRQIDYLHEMGMGGFHMHVRTGLDTEYMGPEYMDRVRDCVEYAESKGMLACLYDEDRWPSGSAGGQVVRENPEFRSTHLLLTIHPYGSIDKGGCAAPQSAAGCRSENGHLLARFSVLLDENGRLESSQQLRPGESPTDGARVWYAYVETNPGSPWFNDQTYVDTMSHKAMARFVEITHEVYKAKIGDKFGTTVPCIFTDEPQVTTKSQHSTPDDLGDVFLPWTLDLPDSFKEAYGSEADLISGIPELVWNLPGQTPSLNRYRYHDHVAERFVSAFLDQLGDWCKTNGLMLNGHMMEEPELRGQTAAHGEAMRCYRSQQIPGMDLLNDAVEFNTAKQVSSVGRQNGIRGAMSEIYGCTHWYFTFEGHKGCGDWQAALGITFRVQHLAWLSMAGEAKRDYPASINYQSPWYKEYGYVEDHFARVGTVLTRGHAVTRVAVVHPIESFWLCFGPWNDGNEMQFRDGAFSDLTNWMLHGLIDFDFISESLLPSQVDKVSCPLKVGKCTYDMVIMPNLRTLRSSTLKIIQKFSAAGGKVLIAGQHPELVDAQVPTIRLTDSLRACSAVRWDRHSILEALEPHRDLRVLDTAADPDGNKPAETLLYQMREDGDDRYVFLCNTDRNNAYDTRIELKGRWDIEILDTFSGDVTDQTSRNKSGWTTFDHKFEGCASLLLRLSPRHSKSRAVETPADHTVNVQVSDQKRIDVKIDKIQLSERNVLVLDYAHYRLDGGSWSERTEVLRIDNEIRAKLDMPRKGGSWRQPWTVTDKEREPRAQLEMVFRFNCESETALPTHLALEDPGNLEVLINGNKVPLDFDSWWVDEDIKRIELPKGCIVQGSNRILVRMPFGILTNLERTYLIGKFGVKIGEDNYPVVTKPRTIKWGDITKQRYPFYVGNVTYHCHFSLDNPSEVTLSVPKFSSPVLKVTMGEKSGHVALQPRTFNFGKLEASEHKFTVTAFGNRFNAFGHFHVPPFVGGCWPDMWRTDGWAWTEKYEVRPIGILEAPTILANEIEGMGYDGEWVVIYRPTPASEAI